MTGVRVTSPQVVSAVASRRRAAAAVRELRTQP
jgi:hypothetical protein